MAVELELKPEVEARIREIARDEVTKRLSGVRDDWSLETMQAAMRRLVELRRKIALPAEELEALLEEHRREMGRGPLTDEGE
jgi:hypothetical protein